MLFQAGQASEHRDIAGRPTNVRWGEAEHIRRCLIEARDDKVASHDDDGNFNGIKDFAQIVTIDPLETGPAAIERTALRRHRAARGPVYSVRLRCSTGSAAVGRT